MMEKGTFLSGEYEQEHPKKLPRRKRILLSLAASFFIFSLLISKFPFFHSRLCHSLFVAPTPAPPEGVRWKSCDDTILCSHVQVPLDYHNASSPLISLALAKYPAPNQNEKLGTLFVNPGGPGGSGVNLIYRKGESISKIVGGKYDIVSWDPRGINGSTPNVACFKSQTDQTLFSLNIRSPEIRNLSDPADLAAYTSERIKVDALGAVSAHLCFDESTSSGILNHVGTTTVVRDLERLSVILEGPDAPVNFWGFSYGTAVGSYFANIFPERVGRLVIDGNIDPVIWSTVPSSDWYKYDLVDSESVLGWFYEYCAQVGPSRCPLATPTSTAQSLAQEVDDLLLRLYESPLPVPHGAKRPGILTSAIVKARIFTALYGIRTWPQLASDLRAAISGNGGPILDVVQAPLTLNVTEPARSEYAGTAVECSDAPQFQSSSKEGWLNHIIKEDISTWGVSPHFAGLHNDVCHHWRGVPSERYEGPWNKTLSNPIVIIGNIADPITPLVNARSTNNLLGNSSRLIIQNSYGHCSMSTASLCTGLALRDYFESNILPPNGVLCQPSEFPFATIDSLWDGLRMSEEERELLNAVRDLGEGIVELTSAGVLGGMRM